MLDASEATRKVPLEVDGIISDSEITASDF